MKISFKNTDTTFYSDSNFIAHNLRIGDVLFDMTDPYSKEKCIKLEQILQEYGYKTRIAKDESSFWSIAIIGKDGD